MFRNSWQQDVAEFHQALDIPISSTPGISRPELRAALIEEEAIETVDAILQGDLIGAIDGLCDLIVVACGAACEFGIDLALFWDEVHRTNMLKKDGPVREDGKRLKPEGWVPPDIAGILNREYLTPEKSRASANVGTETDTSGLSEEDAKVALDRATSVWRMAKEPEEDESSED